MNVAKICEALFFKFHILKYILFATQRLWAGGVGYQQALRRHTSRREIDWIYVGCYDSKPGFLFSPVVPDSCRYPRKRAEGVWCRYDDDKSSQQQQTPKRSAAKSHTPWRTPWWTGRCSRARPHESESHDDDDKLGHCSDACCQEVRFIHLETKRCWRVCPNFRPIVSFLSTFFKWP